MDTAKEINSALQRNIIRAYGKRQQLYVCMEEPAELIQAISKMTREESSLHRDNLAEEIADTLIVIEQLKEIFKLPDELIAEHLERKQMRMVKRLIDAGYLGTEDDDGKF